MFWLPYNIVFNNLVFPPHRSTPHHHNQQYSRPKSSLSDGPEKISNQVLRCFEVRRHLTVDRNKKLRFNFGAKNLSQEKLKRKWIGAPRVVHGFRSNGAIGKRLASSQETKFESRRQHLLNDFYLEHVLWGVTTSGVRFTKFCNFKMKKRISGFWTSKKSEVKWESEYQMLQIPMHLKTLQLLVQN